MTSLRDLQREIGTALLAEGDAAVARAVQDDGIAATARLDLYRHHILTTLTAALCATFPVVCRLVDERFFGYAADRYIRVAPPAGPCLSEYGETFADFLAAFPPCASLPYLPDVARLEWAMARALDAMDEPPLGAEALRACGPESAGGLVFRLDPSLALLASRWPIDAIWHANQSGANEGAAVDLRAGGVRLEVRRLGDDVVFRALASAVHAFRRALGAGERLADATERALALEPQFDLSRALADLLEEGLLTGVTYSPSTEENHRCHSQP
jgi:hypothetical protein